MKRKSYLYYISLHKCMYFLDKILVMFCNMHHTQAEWQWFAKESQILRWLTLYLHVLSVSNYPTVHLFVILQNFKFLDTGLSNWSAFTIIIHIKCEWSVIAKHVQIINKYINMAVLKCWCVPTLSCIKWFYAGYIVSQ